MHRAARRVDSFDAWEHHARLESLVRLCEFAGRPSIGGAQMHAPPYCEGSECCLVKAMYNIVISVLF